MTNSLPLSKTTKVLQRYLFPIKLTPSLQILKAATEKVLLKNMLHKPNFFFHFFLFRKSILELVVKIFLKLFQKEFHFLKLYWPLLACIHTGNELLQRYFSNVLRVLKDCFSKYSKQQLLMGVIIIIVIVVIINIVIIIIIIIIIIIKMSLVKGIEAHMTFG